ncbi:cation transporter [bacterium]|nr:cation transporter [bacterium]MBT3795579.1 cation transporter [bacterium]MBT4634072.1 cation transporter [bacterium]
MKKLRFNFSEMNALIITFALNFLIFLVEFYYGYIENSAALLSDSAHNIGDAVILGTSIFVISSSQKVKAKVAIIKCSIWGLFGLLALYQVYISYMSTQIPSYEVIGWIGFLALVVNIISTLILLSFKDSDVNLKSAYICCRNDAFGNLLVIVAGFFVYRLNSWWPDIIAGLIISFIILISAIKLGMESYNVMKAEKN